MSQRTRKNKLPGSTPRSTLAGRHHQLPRFRRLAVEALEDRRMLSVAPLGEFRLFTDDSLTVPGLVGSYVDDSLRFSSPQDDWRISQTIAGTRIDPEIEFLSNRRGEGLDNRVQETV